MKFGLSDEDLELIRGVLARHSAIERVAIYGSRALGRERPNSDIDLALWGAIDDEILGQVAGELDELPTPYLFDVAYYDEISHDALKTHIDRHGQLLYSK